MLVLCCMAHPQKKSVGRIKCTADVCWISWLIFVCVFHTLGGYLLGHAGCTLGGYLIKTLLMEYESNGSSLIKRGARCGERRGTGLSLSLCLASV